MVVAPTWEDLGGTAAPIVVYWIYSGVLYWMLQRMEQRRMHSRAEEAAKNAVPVSAVIKGVLLQQALQAVVSIALFVFAGNVTTDEPSSQGSYLAYAKQFIVAMLVMDTWQYFLHRYMHHNKFLYRHVHSLHHRLVVPYSFGALYNHPVEGLLLDTIGGALSFLISGMSPRTAMLFFSIATMKTVHDHCGLWLPGNPLNFLFANNTAYHDIHHQLYGTKYNFSQPFFVMWDRIMGTYMPYTIEERLDGGFEARPRKLEKSA